MTPNSNRITAHFRRSEFDQPARHGFAAVPYPEDALPTLARLCEQLEIIRSASRGKITVLSGYRSPPYNHAVGGARNSQHMQGAAADIICDTRDTLELYALILGLHHLGDLSLGGIGAYPTFVHVDVRPGRLVLWRGGRTLV